MTDAAPRRGVLYVIACAAPPASEVHRLIGMCQQRGWDACAVLTPKAQAFVDRPALEALTGYPVRSDYKRPDEPDVLPSPDAIVVAPATFNTVNKWALGIADTLALGLLTEALGMGLPIVVLPSLNSGQAMHPAWEWSLRRLRACGVRVLVGEGGFEPVPPGSGSGFVADFPWERAAAALDAISGAG